MFSFFKKQLKQDLTSELASMRLRNEARAKAQNEKLKAEGKHLLNQKFKWVSADEFAQAHGL